MVIINMVGGIVLTASATHVLNSNDWGSLQEYMLWASNLTVLGIGVPNAVNRQVAYYLAIENKDKAIGVVRRSWIHAWHASLIGAIIGTIILSSRLPQNSTTTCFIGCAIFLIFVCTEPFVQHLDSVFLSSQSYKSFGNALVWQFAAQVVGGYLIFIWGIWGFLIARISVATARLVPKLLSTPIKPTVANCNVKLNELIIVGGPLLLVGFAANQFNSFDRLLASIFLDQTIIGNLSVSTIVTSGILYIPQIIATLYYAKLTGKYAATKDVKSIKIDVVQMLIITGAIVACVCAVMFVLIEPISAIAFKQHISTMVSVKINIIGSLFSSTNCLTVVYAVFQKSRYVLMQLLFSCIIMFLTFLILEGRVDVLNRLAISKTAGNVSFSILLCFFVRRIFSNENKM